MGGSSGKKHEIHWGTIFASGPSSSLRRLTVRFQRDSHVQMMNYDVLIWTCMFTLQVERNLRIVLHEHAIRSLRWFLWGTWFAARMRKPRFRFLEDRSFAAVDFSTMMHLVRNLQILHFWSFLQISVENTWSLRRSYERLYFLSWHWDRPGQTVSGPENLVSESTRRVHFGVSSLRTAPLASQGWPSYAYRRGILRCWPLRWAYSCSAHLRSPTPAQTLSDTPIFCVEMNLTSGEFFVAVKEHWTRRLHWRFFIPWSTLPVLEITSANSRRSTDLTSEQVNPSA